VQGLLNEDEKSLLFGTERGVSFSLQVLVDSTAFLIGGYKEWSFIIRCSLIPSLASWDTLLKVCVVVRLWFPGYNCCLRCVLCF
jgi:hypothetical protein